MLACISKAKFRLFSNKSGGVRTRFSRLLRAASSLPVNHKPRDYLFGLFGCRTAPCSTKKEERKKETLLWDVNIPEASSYLKNSKTVLKQCRTLSFFLSFFLGGHFFPLLGWRNSGGTRGKCGWCKPCKLCAQTYRRWTLLKEKCFFIFIRTLPSVCTAEVPWHQRSNSHPLRTKL